MEFVSMGWDKQMGSIPLGFLPSDLTGLKLWTRFNQGITVTGSGVSQWDDVSGNGNHLKQGTDANRMTKEADGSILGNGVDQFLKADAFTLIQPITVYILGKQVTWAINRRIFDGNTASSGVLFQRTSTPRVSLYAGAAGADNDNFILDTYAVVSSIFNGASSLIQVNNGTSTTGNAGAGNMGGFTLGANADGTLPSNIQAKEVLVYSVAHDAATRAKVIAYLQGI